MSSQQVGGMRVFTVSWVIGDTSPITVVIPDGYRIMDVVSHITTVLDGNGTVTVGYTGAATAFLADADQGGGALGVYRMSAGSAAKKDGYVLGVAEDVIITITVGTSTTGAGKITITAAPSV